MLFLDKTLFCRFLLFFLILPFTQNLCVRLMPHLVVVGHIYYLFKNVCTFLEALMFRESLHTVHHTNQFQKKDDLPYPILNGNVMIMIKLKNDRPFTVLIYHYSQRKTSFPQWEKTHTQTTGNTPCETRTTHRLQATPPLGLEPHTVYRPNPLWD